MENTKENLIDFSIVQSLIELGGDEGKGFLKEIIDLYIEQYPELFNNIKTGSQTNDAVLMYQSAHALKGASLNVGAKELASLCKDVELKGKANDMSGIPELIEAIERIYPVTIDELKKMC
jgi:HPt (histidine-containing phosphotransfer) domain-containing protein